jgi:hypothetical protein
VLVVLGRMRYVNIRLQNVFLAQNFASFCLRICAKAAHQPRFSGRFSCIPQSQILRTGFPFRSRAPSRAQTAAKIRHTAKVHALFTAFGPPPFINGDHVKLWLLGTMEE